MHYGTSKSLDSLFTSPFFFVLSDFFSVYAAHLHWISWMDLTPCEEEEGIWTNLWLENKG